MYDKEKKMEEKNLCLGINSKKLQKVYIFCVSIIWLLYEFIVFDYASSLNAWRISSTGELVRNYSDFWILTLLSLIILIIAVIIFFMIFRNEIIVTNKRVFGKSAFGKRIDLPLDSISSVEISFFRGIAIGTSSGRIRFYLITNYFEIHSCISELIINRQKHKNNSIISPSDSVYELKKYKELLDDRIITQEEFDAKKKQLLGL